MDASLVTLLEGVDGWSFDVFAVQQLCPKDTLLVVGMRLMQVTWLTSQWLHDGVLCYGWAVSVCAFVWSLLVTWLCGFVGHSYRALQNLDLLERFSIPEATLSSYLQSVSEAYLDNPYHNALHGGTRVERGCVLVFVPFVCVPVCGQGGRGVGAAAVRYRQ